MILEEEITAFLRPSI